MTDSELEKAILNKHLVFGLIDLGPIFFINGRIYYCLESSNPNTSGFLIKEGPKIEVLEKISDEILKQEYERYKKSFLEESTKNVCSLEPNKVINFIFNGIFSHLRKDSDALESLLEIDTVNEVKKESLNLDDKTKKYIDEIKNNLNKKMYRLPKENRASISPEFNSRILESVNGYNFAVFDGNLFLLSETREGENAKVSIGNRGYSLIKSIALSEFKKDFINNSSLTLKIEALDNQIEDSNFCSELKANISKFNLLSTEDNYEEEDFGFIKKANGAYVYVNVPDHVLKSPYNNDYFKFDSHKIGIDIGLTGNSPRILRFPYTVENVEGPFYRLGEHVLCMGNYDYSFIETSTDKGEAFAKLLADARKVTLRGYGNYGGTPHRQLDRNNFNHRLISYEEAKKIGITNINTQTKKWMH